MRKGLYRCGDCRKIHAGNPDLLLRCCPACKALFLAWYARFVQEVDAKQPKQEQLAI
jgi:hypothetical protein